MNTTKIRLMKPMGRIRQIRRTIAVVGFGALATNMAMAQSVTYNHDSAKKNQITVMETGGGSLTPELYYWTLHNSYLNSATL